MNEWINARDGRKEMRMHFLFVNWISRDKRRRKESDWQWWVILAVVSNAFTAYVTPLLRAFFLFFYAEFEKALRKHKWNEISDLTFRAFSTRLFCSAWKTFFSIPI